ncbi:MAG: hypothetical protein KDJ22_04895 [Candidatus Competibacteraceae bacterium]|nr:hypothetical protein [Candidatus Competibacteraceae bacterium]MCP5126988.1 hypothetical protein [Gammaproteobacteria bacterium]HRX70492.1 hypothetical protein [Candidatus Competibacteraceae bacterium]
MKIAARINDQLIFDLFWKGLLTERQTWLPMLEQLESDAELLATFDVNDMPTEALLF